MNKYDFGYDLNKDAANLWAFQSIRPGTTVLEIGSSNGRLTKHLKEERGCIVDIVEINQEAGEDAAKFSRYSYLGEVDGNIESQAVIDSFIENEYDYIIFLDVLEHLFDPGLVLQRMKKLLKADGEFVISIPNIAHNSVIINLINNHFRYTDVGLLDNTHLHFYTADTICQMIKDAGFYVQKISAVQRRVGDNEIENSYADIPRDITAFLRSRDQADVYQILILAGRKRVVPEPRLTVKNLDYTLYKAQIYMGGTEKESIDYFVDPKKIEIEIDVKDHDYRQPIRVDPIDTNCILKIGKVVGNNGKEEYSLPIISTNGEALYNGEYVFWDDDPQIYFQCPKGTERVVLSISCPVYDSAVLPHFKDLGKELLRMSEREIDEKKQAKLKDQYIKQYLDAINARDCTIENLKRDILDQNAEIESINRENITIKQQNQQIAEESKRLNHDISVIQHENYTVKAQNEEIHKMNLDYQNDIALLKRNAEHVMDKTSRLEQALDLKDKENIKLIQDIDIVKLECLQAKDTLNVYTQKLEELDRTIKKLSFENANLKKHLDEDEAKLNEIHGHLIYKIISKIKKGN